MWQYKTCTKLRICLEILQSCSELHNTSLKKGIINMDKHESLLRVLKSPKKTQRNTDYDTLTLLIPSYFGPTLYTKGGSSGPPYYLMNTWLYKPQILQGIRDTLQRLRKHKVCKNLLYGYHPVIIKVR